MCRLESNSPSTISSLPNGRRFPKRISRLEAQSANRGEFVGRTVERETVERKESSERLVYPELSRSNDLQWFRMTFQWFEVRLRNDVSQRENNERITREQQENKTFRRWLVSILIEFSRWRVAGGWFKMAANRLRIGCESIQSNPPNRWSARGTVANWLQRSLVNCSRA